MYNINFQNQGLQNINSPSPMNSQMSLGGIGQMMAMMQAMMQSLFGGGQAGMPMMPQSAMPMLDGMTGVNSNGNGAFPQYPSSGQMNSSAGGSITHQAGNFSQGPRTQYDALINAASQKHGVDPALIKAVIKQESGFRNQRTSSAGAAGLMQLMPATARGLGVTNVMDPAQNIDGGTKYLAQMLKKYKGNVSLALAAYNAGPGNVNKHGGIPPFRETQEYVRKITADYAQSR